MGKLGVLEVILILIVVGIPLLIVVLVIRATRTTNPDVEQSATPGTNDGHYQEREGTSPPPYDAETY